MRGTDRKLCEAVLSPGAEIGRLSLVEVKRNGALLLALPLRRRLALVTLGLYQPQRWKGRLLKSVMRVLVSTGIYKMLPKLEFTIGDRGVFRGFEGKVPPGGFGFLLGSADSQSRNLIALADIGGDLRVVKAGCGEAAAVVREESGRMTGFSCRVRGVPACLGSFDIEDGAAYIAERVSGMSPRGARGDQLVFALLRDWLEAGETARVSELPCWQALHEMLSAAERERLDGLAKAQVLSPVMHGDFAPWNIKVDKQSQVRVLDWEAAEERGMPGWDWLHYHVQRLRLVEDAPAKEVISRCRSLLSSASAGGYLQTARLSGHEDALLGAYLYFSGRVQGYQREELIEALWTV